MFGEEDIVKAHKARADLILNLMLMAMAIIVARLWYLQIYIGKTLREYSLANQMRREVVVAPRGMIYSRDNQLLVHNVPRFDVVITPQYLKNAKVTIAKLSKIIDLAPERIQQILKRNAGQASYRPVIIKKNLSRQEVAIIETENYKMPGITVHSVVARDYIDGAVGAHLLGYISEISPAQLPIYTKRDKFVYRLGDFIGQAGVEEEYDLQLRGTDGHEYVVVDAMGRSKIHRHGGQQKDDVFPNVENVPALPGHNIRLTVDRDLQLAAAEALKGKVGSLVAVDIDSGEILAMVSHPAFNPSALARGASAEYWDSLSNDENGPMKNRAIQEHYSPGSTFKVVTAIAALEEGIIDENTEVNCTGSFQLGQRKFHCWRKNGHGNVNLHRAIEESCDTFFYKIATKLDIDVLATWAKNLGFGMRTGIKLPREVAGTIPTKEYKLKRFGQEWQLGETLSCAIGQSYVLVTTLQLAMAYAAIANQGKLYRPYLVKEIFSNDGKVVMAGEPHLVAQVGLKPQTFRAIQRGLMAVVNGPHGTARGQRGLGIHLAGKTGTSQVVRSSADKIFMRCEDKEYKYRHHALFVGYAPYDKPRIAAAAVIEHGCHGASAAGPVVREVINAYMAKYYPEQKKKYSEGDLKYYAKLKAAPAEKNEESEDQQVVED